MTGAGRQDAEGSGATACALVAAGALLCLGATVCTEPRARPLPPSVQIAMQPHLVIASPGLLTGSVVVFDANGVDSVHVRVDLGDGSTLGDSLYFANGDPFQDTLPILWQIPGGLPFRTSVKVMARARSYIGFTGADSVLTAIGDTLP
ncbi:MAG: hypothetical protein ABSB58_06460 [Gemmatimonadales bacterium]|jgi:hypothetical protein